MFSNEQVAYLAGLIVIALAPVIGGVGLALVAAIKAGVRLLNGIAVEQQRVAPQRDEMLQNVRTLTNGGSVDHKRRETDASGGSGAP